MDDLQRTAAEKLYWTGGVWAEIARACYGAAEYGRATKMARKAIALGDRSPSLFGMLAAMALVRGDADDTESHAKKGLEHLERNHQSAAHERTRSELMQLAIFARQLRKTADADKGRFLAQLLGSSDSHR